MRLPWRRRAAARTPEPEAPPPEIVDPAEVTTDPAHATAAPPPATLPTTLIAALDAHVEARGEAIFTRHLTGGAPQELSFGGFRALAGLYGDHLHAAGVREGDVVLIFLPASPDQLAAFVGAMTIGAIPSLMPLPSAKQHAAVYWPSHIALLDRIRPRLLLTDAAHAGAMAAHGLADDGRAILAIDALPDDVPPAPAFSPAERDIALLQHSSGTTGLKKGVALSHRAILRQARSYAARLGAGAEDGIVSWLPAYHDMGLIACTMMPLITGQTVTILDPFQWVARPATMFEAIAAHDARFVWMPNFAFEHLVRAVPADDATDLSGVRAFIDCSEPCKPETFDRFAARFAGNGVRPAQLQVCYAMAETVFAVTQTQPGEPVRRATVDRDLLQRAGVARAPGEGAEPATFLATGTPIDGVAITIRQSGRVLDEDHVGEIIVTGDFLFDGYFADPETTAERLVGGRYRTRDLGFIRDGHLYVLGRKDDLLIVGGRNLHAHEVEAIVAGVAGLKPGRAVAFGVYNETQASQDLVIVAERDPEAGIDDAEIARLVREAVSDRTSIDVRDVSIVAPGEMVKTTSGKISRQNVAARYRRAQDAAREAVPAPASPAGDGDALARIVEIIGRTFRVAAARIGRATVATDIAGWDSLAHSTLVLEIERALGIRFPDEEIFAFENVGALADRAASLVAAGGGTPDDRIIAETDAFSIVAMGEGDGPDLVIFAGAAQSFGGQNMLDFASTLRGTAAERSRRLFITDRTKRWFTDSIEPIAAVLAEASPGAKILIGNSMGGYGALAFAPRLANVAAVLAFAPQPAPPKGVARTTGRDGPEWLVRPAPGVPTCILYGEVEDEIGKRWVSKTFTDPAHHTLLTVPNCGHNVVSYLNGRELLGPALTTALDPATMGAEMTRIVGLIEPSYEELRERVLGLKLARMGRGLAYLEERYPGRTTPGAPVTRDDPA